MLSENPFGNSRLPVLWTPSDLTEGRAYTEAVEYRHTTPSRQATDLKIASKPWPVPRIARAGNACAWHNLLCENAKRNVLANLQLSGVFQQCYGWLMIRKLEVSFSVAAVNVFCKMYVRVTGKINILKFDNNIYLCVHTVRYFRSLLKI